MHLGDCKRSREKKSRKQQLFIMLCACYNIDSTLDLNGNTTLLLENIASLTAPTSHSSVSSPTSSSKSSTGGIAGRYSNAV